MCIADASWWDLKANYCAPGDNFAGRRICFHTTAGSFPYDMSALQRLGDCCRRLLGSHGVDVQVSYDFEGHQGCAKVGQCLGPHLCRLSAHSRGFFDLRLQLLLPAAAQLAQVTSLEFDVYAPENISLLGQSHMLTVLHVNVWRPVQLTAPLPRLQTLGLRFYGSLVREYNLQCLFSAAPALRQLDLEYKVRWGPFGLDRWDLDALVGLQCQQLHLLTSDTDTITEHTVKLLACIQCPLKLRIGAGLELELLEEHATPDTAGKAPRFGALTFISLQRALNALWDRRGALLPDVQRLEIVDIPLDLSDSQLPIKSILSMCPALRHLSLHACPPLSLAAQPEVLCAPVDAFQSHAKLVSLTCE